jgi:proline iminopeptidase
MKEEYIVCNGIRIWTVTQGQGTPILLCNGGLGCADYLGPVADMLDELAQVIRYEQRGCGRSERKPPFNLEIFIKDIESIRKHYSINKWIVGGHSWRANLALAYALAHPNRVLGVIYLSGTGFQHDVDWRAAKNKASKERGERRPAFSGPFSDFVYKQLYASWHELIKTPLLYKRLTKLKMPALFIHGKFDIRPVWPVE